MIRQRIAEKVTALMSGENQLMTFACAAALLSVVCFAGRLAAGAAAEVGLQLRRSEIVSRLLPSEKAAGDPALLLRDTQSIEPFLRYLNAMAPALTNLTVSPARQIDCFTTIYEASRSAEVTLEEFEADPAGSWVQFSFQADAQAAEQLLILLRENKSFSLCDFVEQPAQDVKKFTIVCNLDMSF